MHGGRSPAPRETVMLNSKHLKMTRLASHQIKALGKEIVDYTRASEISPDLAAELHALRDEVIGLGKLIEFLAHGIEFKLWEQQQEKIQ